MQWFIQETQERAKQWTDVFRDHEAFSFLYEQIKGLRLSITLKFLHKRRLCLCFVDYYLKNNFTYKSKPTFTEYPALCSGTRESKSKSVSLRNACNWENSQKREKQSDLQVCKTIKYYYLPFKMSSHSVFWVGKKTALLWKKLETKERIHIRQVFLKLKPSFVI